MSGKRSNRRNDNRLASPAGSVTGNSPSRRTQIHRGALVSGVVVLLIAGVGQRMVARTLERADVLRALPRGTLAAIPLQIGEWTGTDAPLDEAIVEAADVDDYLNRLYRSSSELEPVGLYVALGVRARDLMPHRPEVCYPGAGWTLRSTEDFTIAPEHGLPVQARLYRFSPGGLDARDLLVVHYYLVDGATAPDVSILRAKAWRGQTSIRYMAQVQITCRSSAEGAAPRVRAGLRAFSEVVAPAVRAALDHLDTDSDAGDETS